MHLKTCLKHSWFTWDSIAATNCPLCCREDKMADAFKAVTNGNARIAALMTERDKWKDECVALQSQLINAQAADTCHEGHTLIRFNGRNCPWCACSAGWRKASEAWHRHVCELQADNKKLEADRDKLQVRLTDSTASSEVADARFMVETNLALNADLSDVRTERDKLKAELDGFVKNKAVWVESCVGVQTERDAYYERIGVLQADNTMLMGQLADMKSKQDALQEQLAGLRDAVIEPAMPGYLQIQIQGAHIDVLKADLAAARERIAELELMYKGAEARFESVAKQRNVLQAEVHQVKGQCVNLLSTLNTSRERIADLTAANDDAWSRIRALGVLNDEGLGDLKVKLVDTNADLVKARNRIIVLLGRECSMRTCVSAATNGELRETNQALEADLTKARERITELDQRLAVSRETVAEVVAQRDEHLSQLARTREAVAELEPF